MSNNALILSDNVIVANQIANLLCNLNLRAKTVYNRIDAYTALDRSTHLESEGIGVLITDIENPELDGNIIAGWYRAVAKNISWYAICRPNCAKMPMLVAQAQGVDGIFYLNRNGVGLDPTLGLTREVLNVRPLPKRVLNVPTRVFPSAPSWIDSGLLVGT